MPPLKSMIQSIRRKPTKNADGRSDAELAASVGATDDKRTTILHDVTHLGAKSAATMAQALTTLASGEPMDDKELLLEHGVSMLQSFPPNSGLSQAISDGFISMLWGDLPHPAPTLSGPSTRYRRHDGGGNVPWDPEMGKAGTPYARNVPPMKPKGPNLPDVESVYDALLKREGPFRKHPSGLNRMFFSFATVVIHECFQTSRDNPFINETSSYVDLSTLYGNTEKEQPRVRTYENGLIYPDSIASERILMMPPGVVAVLITLSRNHNHVAQNLLSINEDGKYKPWDQLNEAQKKWQDEDIFQLTRNINVGYFASCVLGDYVAAILNTPRANSNWSLNLGKEIKEAGSRVTRGIGNVVSVEFAVLYHWHAALSAADDQWMQSILKKYAPTLTDLEDITVPTFLDVMKGYGHDLMVDSTTTPPSMKPAKGWTFGGLKRGPDGSFNDADIANILLSCIEEPAHEFGAHGTPLSLKIVDIMGQLQAREVFNVCTLNEFRRYLNLKAYASFEEWNPNKEVARRAELLYGHIENMELYPGLMAECTKPPIPGSGVCPGQSTGRGILDDAVSLVRGDRFLSYDFNSNTQTNWGASTLSERHPGAYGGMLPNLLFNALPGTFSGTSSYAILPFYTPEAVQGILKGNKAISKYDITRPTDRSFLSVQTVAGVKAVLADTASFRTVKNAPVAQASSSKISNGVTNGVNGVKAPALTPSISEKAIFEPDFEKLVTGFFSTTVQKLIEDNSLKFVKGRASLDVVRDVTNIAPILWLADRFAIPLKTANRPRGIISIYDTFISYLSVYLYQNENFFTAKEWAAREAAAQGTAKLQPIFETHLKTQRGVAERVVDWLAKGSAFQVGPNADRLYHALNDTKKPIPELASEVLGMGAPVAGTLTQQASQLINMFLSDFYAPQKKRLVELAAQDPATSEAELQAYVREGIRLHPAIIAVPRIATKDTTIEDGIRGPITVPAGRTVLAATSKAAIDETIFPEPSTFNATRPIESYALLDEGLHSVFGSRLTITALSAILREVFKLKGVRKAKGKLGNFTTVERSVTKDGVQVKRFLDSSSKESPFPTSLTIEYDV